MKKAVFAVFLMMMCLSLFAQNGTVKEISGTVELKNAGTAAFVPAALGDQVRQDTVISTGFKSSAMLEVGSAVIVVRPLTRLTLTEIRSSAGTETLNVNLQAGRVRVDVTPPSGTKASMTVSSPSATASVRGTRFDIDTRGVHVFHGNVAYKGGKGGWVNVDSGTESKVQANGKSSNPHGNKRAGFQPSAPVGKDPASGPANGTGPIEVFKPSKPTDPPPPPAQPSRPPVFGGGGGGGASGGDVDIQIDY